MNHLNAHMEVLLEATRPSPSKFRLASKFTKRDQRGSPPLSQRLGALNSPETRRSLERMVSRLTSQHFWHEDLIQEAMIHWWRREGCCPGQSRAWYLRSCQYFLRNRLRLGRSVDSPKHDNNFARVSSGQEDLLGSLVDGSIAASVMEVVIARDLVSVLLPSLTRAERTILACLLDGRGARETARHLGVSHTCVVKKRRRIAAMVAQQRLIPSRNTAEARRARR